MDVVSAVAGYVSKMVSAGGAEGAGGGGGGGKMKILLLDKETVSSRCASSALRRWSEA